MKICKHLLPVVLGLLVLAGCGKKNTSAPVSLPLAESNATSAATPHPAGPPVSHPAPPSQVSLPANATADAAAEQLTLELRRYVLSTRTIPKDFEDFVARHPMQFPPAPAGKHYAIDGGKVIVR